MRASRLRAAHPQCLLLPVQIVEPQADDLAGPQGIGDQHHQDGAVAQVGRSPSVVASRRRTSCRFSPFGTVSPGWNRDGMIPSANPGLHQC